MVNNSGIYFLPLNVLKRDSSLHKPIRFSIWFYVVYLSIKTFELTRNVLSMMERSGHEILRKKTPCRCRYKRYNEGAWALFSKTVTTACSPFRLSLYTGGRRDSWERDVHTLRPYSRGEAVRERWSLPASSRALQVNNSPNCFSEHFTGLWIDYGAICGLILNTIKNAYLCEVVLFVISLQKMPLYRNNSPGFIYLASLCSASNLSTLPKQRLRIYWNPYRSI